MESLTVKHDRQPGVEVNIVSKLVVNKFRDKAVVLEYGIVRQKGHYSSVIPVIYSFTPRLEMGISKTILS